MMANRSDGIGRWAKHWPIATFVGAVLALLIYAVPGLSELAQFQKSTWLSEPWRIFSSHLTHFSSRHLVYDLIVFVGLGWACEKRWPTRTRITLALSASTIPMAFLGTLEHLDTYRGLSGLGSALLVLLAAGLHREKAFQSPIARYLPLATSLGFLAKLLFEITTGQSFFVSQASLFEPVPIAHLIGGLIGLGMAWLPNPMNRAQQSATERNRAQQSATERIRVK
jgi:rhomboid family GlyGly-CTERM serine protease